MSFGFRRARRRRRNILRSVVTLVLFGALAGAVFYVYSVGERHGRVAGDAILERLAALEGENRRLAEVIEAADRARERAEGALREADARYTRDVPAGSRKVLLDKITERLEAGVAAERLTAVIAAAENERACEPAVTRRLMIRTPQSQGPATTTTFADNQIAITGDGVSARDAANNPEAWFDTEKPVTLRFMLLGGQTSEAQGRLPLQHSMVSGDYEYRFAIHPATRGFVAVTGDRCRYP